MTPSTGSVYCPACRGGLAAHADDTLRCPACGHLVPLREGIPLLGSTHDYYYAEIPLDAMEWYLARARAGEAARVFEQPDHPGPWAFLLGSHFDPTRAAWKVVTALPAEGYRRVLDFGCGWGVNALALAPHAGEVVAMDLSWHRLLSLRLLADRQGRDNVTVVCGGDRLPLPFPDDHFDLVVLVGLIEWIPVGRPGDPRRLQLDLLRDIARVTRPDGEIFLASENRVAYSYWTGRPDDHTGLRFGALLPRPMANLYSRLTRGEPYRHYTYTRGQYRRLLGDAGFAHTEFHGLIPAHRLYHKIFPLARGRVVDAEETRGSRLKDRLLGSRWAARLASAFGIRAGAAALPRSYVQRLCRHVRDTIGPADLESEPYRLVTTNFCVKAAVRAAHGDGVLIRIPLTERKRALVANARREQERWHRDARVSPWITSSLTPCTFDGLEVTIETRATGAAGRPPDGAPAWEQVGTVLEAFAGTRGVGSVRDVTAEILADPFRDHLGPDHTAVRDALLGSARLAALPACYRHGDFHWENLLTRDGTLDRIVDWEWATPDGAPLADLFHLAVNDGGVGFGPQVLDVLARAVRGTYPRPALAALATRLRRVHGIAEDDLPAFAVIYLYDVLRQHWLASESYFLGRRFLPDALRTVADRVPTWATTLMQATS